MSPQAPEAQALTLGLRRTWLVWGVGVFAYIVAVMHRTSFGVSGLDAALRFSIGPNALASFVVLQIAVYAALQIPAGVLLDRWGSRRMIATGALIMALGQLTLALTSSLPLAVGARVLVGAGDALTFISVLRLIPFWFPPRRAPLMTQLTAIVGQVGQILSTVPLLALLHGPGWSSAYGVASALGMLAFCAALIFIRNSPSGESVATARARLSDVRKPLQTVWLRPGTRLGFFSHMGTQFSGMVFALLWGLPYLVEAQGLPASVGSALLTLFVLSSAVIGPAIGILTARHPLRRSWIVLGVIASNVLMWTAVLALPGPAPLWLLVLLVVVLGAGGPGSAVGFDFARTSNPSVSLGVAQGMVNQGGFLATLLVVGAIGLVLNSVGGYGFDSFRLAWLVQYPVWAVAIAGVLITRRKARRVLAADGVVPRPLREVVWRRSEF